jgi:hypothetical protein
LPILVEFLVSRPRRTLPSVAVSTDARMAQRCGSVRQEWSRETLALTSHAGGPWFDPRCAHSSEHGAPPAVARYRPLVACARRCARFAQYIGTPVGLIVLTGGLASIALARVAGPDRTPPKFGGLESATMCVPGPNGGQSANHQLRWATATDDVTPSNKIVYDIYQATMPGGETSPPRRTPHAAATPPSRHRHCRPTQPSTSWSGRETARATAIPIRSSARA